MVKRTIRVKAKRSFYLNNVGKICKLFYAGKKISTDKVVNVTPLFYSQHRESFHAPKEEKNE